MHAGQQFANRGAVNIFEEVATKIADIKHYECALAEEISPLLAMSFAS